MKPKRDPKTGRFLQTLNISRDELYRMYVEEKLSTSVIAKLYGVSSETIRYWMKKYNIPRRTLAESHTGYRRGSKPHLPTPKPESFLWKLGWILGYTQGDGHVSYKTHRKVVQYGSTKVETVEVIRKIIENTFEISSKIYTTNRNVQIVYGSPLYDILTGLAKFGTDSWEVPRVVKTCENNQIKLGYITGFFDAEGTVILKSTNKRIDIISVNLKGLKELSNLFPQVNLIKPRLTLGRKGSENLKPLYKLTICGRDALLEFSQVITPMFPEKAQKLKEIYNSFKK